MQRAGKYCVTWHQYSRSPVWCVRGLPPVRNQYRQSCRGSRENEEAVRGWMMNSIVSAQSCCTHTHCKQHGIQCSANYSSKYPVFTEVIPIFSVQYLYSVESLLKPTTYPLPLFFFTSFRPTTCLCMIWMKCNRLMPRRPRGVIK